MNWVLTRSQYVCGGVFSVLTDDQGQKLAFTVERLFDGKPKIPNGTFMCVRGTHELHDLRKFTTFEITGVQGHSNLLFHHGNYVQDSDGCVVVGGSLHENADGSMMVLDSDKTFEKLLSLQDGINEFELTVQG